MGQAMHGNDDADTARQGSTPAAPLQDLHAHLPLGKPSPDGIRPPLDLTDIANILLGCDDETFIEQLLVISRIADSPYTTQEGPRVVHRPVILARLATIMREHTELFEGVFLAGLRPDRRFNIPSLLVELRRIAPRAMDSMVLIPPETLTQLLAADIPAPLHLFEGLLHEGLLLFGGKSKRGKSWLIFDLALSLAVGRSGFRHFACPEPRPILYLALEDGRARLQSRARAIQPNLTTANTFHLRYTFPPLSEGGIDALTAEIVRHHYGLVIIDVLAKLEPPAQGKGDKSYHEVYDMFAPLQALRQEHPFCLAMLTHLRKQEADDVFDSLMGSVAYQGAQDVLWVLERKPKDDFAFLHLRDKDAEDKTIALHFLDGHWEYVGEGEEYEVNRDQRKVIKVLSEEKREMSIQDILKAAEFPDAKYGYVRKLLVSMVKDDLIHRARQGKYSATVRAVQEMVTEDDAPPF